MRHTQLTMGPNEWALLVGLAILWGGSFFFVEVGLQDLAPTTLVFLRVAVAAVALNLVVVVRRLDVPTRPADWAPFFLLGLLNNLIPFSLIMWGQTHISGALAAILTATTPIFTVVAAHFLTSDEKMTANRLAGVVTGFVGAAVIIGPSAARELASQALAQVAVIAAAIAYSFAGIFGRRFRDRSPIVVAAGQLTATTILMLPIVVYALPTALLDVRPTTWTAVVCLALFSTSLAYIIYFRLLASAGATNVLLVTLLMPVGALALGATFLGERIGNLDVAGMTLILIGLVLIDGRALRRLQAAAVDRRPPKTAL